MARPRSYTDEELRRAAATSRSMRELMGKLGLNATNSHSVRAYADQLGVTLPDGRRRFVGEHPQCLFPECQGRNRHSGLCDSHDVQLRKIGYLRPLGPVPAPGNRADLADDLTWARVMLAVYAPELLNVP